MGARLRLHQVVFAAGILLVVVMSHHLLYQGLFGQRAIDPHEPPSPSVLPEIVSTLVVLLAVAVGSLGLPSTGSALVGAVWAGLATETYFVLRDWLRVGWGGLVGHDVWFGDTAHWILVTVQAFIVIGALSVVAGATRSISARLRSARWLTKFCS